MTNRPLRRSALVLGVTLAVTPVAVFPLSGLPAAGQLFGGGQQAPKQRTCDGKVVNKSEAPLAGAVVYLKDTKSLSVRTYICDDAGHFHFGQLLQNTDYDIWADSNGTQSKHKSISSFDAGSSYNFTLTIAN